MYPANKGADAVHSGTGVFYQAMPAVGADGKNIMKLIPVQMVNGQFVQTQIAKPKIDPALQKPVTINIASAPVQMIEKAAVNPSDPQQVDKKQVPLVNALPNQVGLDPHNSLNKHPLQQQSVNVIPLMATPATNCEKSVRLPNQLPVTVKSPALPRGQYLQIPSNAQVRIVPASELPPGIKKQIFTSSACISPGSGSPSVVYVSPITTVNQGVTPPSDCALQSLKLLSKTSNQTSCGPPSTGSKPQLKLIPKVSQRPNSPIRWVIEEEDSSTLDPLNSPSLTSESVPWAGRVADRGNCTKPCDVITNPVSQLSQGKNGQVQENALVMCNGKVFFVAKKCSLPFKMGKSDSSTAPIKSYEFNKTMVPSSQQTLESVAPERRKDFRIILTDESDEVIDLCDDDSQEKASVNMSAVTHLDEDNVIFVSYIPPKSQSAATQDLIPKTQMTLGKETDQMGTSSSNTVIEQKSMDCTTGNDGTIRNLKHVCGSAVMNMHNNEGSKINTQQSTSVQQLENMEVDVESETPADLSTSESSSGISPGINTMESSMNRASWTSSLAPQSLQMADCLLRQIFRITADVKICLQRIDEASAGSVPAEPPQSESIRSLEHHQNSTSRLTEKELFSKDLYGPQETDNDNGLINVKEEVKVLTEKELPADPATPSPHTHVDTLKCSRFKLNTNPPSAVKCHLDQNSLKGPSGDVEIEPVIGYVEPIDENFISTDENDIPNSQDTDAQPVTPTCEDLNITTRRMGRTRKRTICPCCIPGTHNTAVKSSAKFEPEWAWTKGGSTKAVRKDVKTSGKISYLTAKNKQNCKTYEVPTSDNLSTTSIDFDLKQHKQIKRLKELLREKEAALELMRNSRS